ncbi:hypothetical protein KXX44_003578 [Aspergillus fumigatus]|nr:hypothetical protein KXX44_003578 [Aspergillus fumigatus]KAH1859616.1 hypothetical protein KXX55_003099 [Aspergillus fumigatus]KAH2444895.1 hypothetical protein KXV83_001800 [Aspergillus fumigatus]KAH2980024.1 hypothetical protein KXW58_003113 [Aspergillus fumigatus]KAH3050613.1 hypothetical protein KXW01_005396 [Aspergillus fumigatus]
MANSLPSEVPYATQGDSVDNPILIDCGDINTVGQTPHGSVLPHFDDGAFQAVINRVESELPAVVESLYGAPSQEVLERYRSELGVIAESLYGTPSLNPIVTPESKADHSNPQGNHSLIIESQPRSESTARTGSPASPCPECLARGLQELSPVDVGVQTATPIRNEIPAYMDASTQTTPQHASEENQVGIPEALNSRKRKRDRFAPSSMPLRRSSRLRTG